MTLTITAVQRAAIYDDVLHDLTGVGDIYIYIEQGDIGAAQRCGLDVAALVDDHRELLELVACVLEVREEQIRGRDLSARRHDDLPPTDPLMTTGPNDTTRDASCFRRPWACARTGAHRIGAARER